MTILSSYLLDSSNNDRIERAVAPFGDTFIPAPATREERIALLDSHIAEADILLGGRVSAEQWESARNLRWIHVPWAGVNSLLALEPLRTSGILITNSSGVMSDAVADQVMGYIIALSRSFPEQFRAQEERKWIDYDVESPRRRILRGATLGIIGYGAIGRGIAERAGGFGMRVIASRQQIGPTPPELDLLLPSDKLHELLAQSDYVVVTVPLNNATTGMIGQREFTAMKPTAYFINIARGGIVKEEEMIAAFRNRTIAGGALDVFATEPLPETSPLRDVPDLILTPHSAGGYRGFWNTTVDLFLDNLQRYRDGEPLRNVVDAGGGY